MTSRQDELVVHEVTLDGSGTFSDEGFLDQGSGSAFESRVSELVFVTPSSDGLGHLPDRVEKMVGKGFHHVVLSLTELSELPHEALQALMRVKSYLGTWGGSLRVCNTSGDMEHKLTQLGVDEHLAIHPDLDTAVKAHRATIEAQASGASGEGEIPPVEDPDDWGWGSGDQVSEEKEGLAPVPVAEVFVEDNDLGKLDTDLRRVVTGGKKHVSLRLHFDRRVGSDDIDDLIACRDYLSRAGGQLVLVSLPADVLKSFKLLEFDKEFLIVETGDDADMAHRRHAAGLQPISDAPSLEESPFVVVSQDGGTFVVRPREAQDRTSVKRTSSEIPLLNPGENLASVAGRLKQLGGEGALVDLGKHRDASDGRPFEPLREAAAVAKEYGQALVFSNVSHEVRALLKVLGITSSAELTLRGAVLNLASQIHAQAPFEELRVDLAREKLSDGVGAGEPSVEFESGITLALDTGVGQVVDDGQLNELRVQVAKAQGEADRHEQQARALKQQLQKVEEDRDRYRQEAQELQASSRHDNRRLTELEQAKDRAVQRAAEAESGVAVSRADTKRLEDEVTRLRQELDGLRSSSATAIAKGEQVGRLEAALREKDATIKKLRDEAKQVVGDLISKTKSARHRVHELESSDVETLRQRCGELEEEKARILTEAEAEIKRLSEEQRLLREELESAGEMIERLGKELELS